MKKLMSVISMLFSAVIAIAQNATDSITPSKDGTTSGYSGAATIGLIILILVIVGSIAVFTWRKNEQKT